MHGARRRGVRVRAEGGVEAISPSGEGRSDDDRSTLWLRLKHIRTGGLEAEAVFLAHLAVAGSQHTSYVLTDARRVGSAIFMKSGAVLAPEGKAEGSAGVVKVLLRADVNSLHFQVGGCVFLSNPRCWYT